MIEFEVERSPWETAVQLLRKGDSISALVCLERMEGMSEDAVCQALLTLEERGIGLDISQLPKDVGNGEAALRLKQEQQFVQNGCDLRALEENDPLRLYLEELSCVPAAGDEEVLAVQYLQGNDTTQQLTNLALGRVTERAFTMTGRGVLLLDLIQEGSLGLWQGILNYTGGDYVNHITWWIDQYLAKTVFLQARAGGLGAKLRQGMEDYRQADQKLLGDLGRNPTLEEIAEAIHVSVQEAAAYGEMLSQARTRQQVEQARQPKEITADDEQAVESTAYFQTRQRIQEMLSTLAPQQAQLLTLRFGLEGGLPISSEEAGKRLGLTAEEAINMEAAALAKLRQQEA